MVLIDSGCMDSCISKTFVHRNKALIPAKVYNADGMLNAEYYVTLHISIDDHNEKIQLGVVDIGRSILFLGYDWLTLH